MFILDDIVLRSLGVRLPAPLDTLSTLELIEEAGLKELYDPKKIKNQLKEISLLLDTGKMTREDFERKKEDLISQLSVAEEVREMSMKRQGTDAKLL